MNLRIMVSGGGTGGHIFPALSIADAIKAKMPEAKILFVGADNRMEMQRVPDAGYEIVGLPIAGFDRKNLLKNIKVVWKILKSQRMARRIIKDFAPQAAVGVGGYASGPTLKMAASMGIPTLIQEQNSYAGVTNKILSKQAKMICVAYDGMERFFPADKIALIYHTGDYRHNRTVLRLYPGSERRRYFPAYRPPRRFYPRWPCVHAANPETALPICLRPDSDLCSVQRRPDDSGALRRR